MRSLRALTIAFLLVFSLATALTGYATHQASRRAIDALVDRRIEAVADAVLEGVAPGDARVLVARIADLAGRRETGDLGFELIDRAGRRLGGNVALPRRLARGFSGLRGDDRIVGLSAGRALVRDAGRGLRLTVVAETEPVDGDSSARRSIAVLGFGGIAVVVLAGTALFGLLVRRRIDEVRGTAEAIVAGDLSRRVPVPAGGGAFAAQAVAFNRMLERIGALMDSLRHVSGDVAHDLRTPLTRLRARLVRLGEGGSAAEQAAGLEQAIAQCDALLAMFAAVLRIGEVEGGGRRAAFAPVDLGAVAQEVVETMAPLAAEGGHRLALLPSPGAMGMGDRQLVSQALINLVENALSHTPAGTGIMLSIRIDDGRVTLLVADDGPGIAASDRPRALRRFGRLDASRDRPGHGLGLPLVDAVARLHGSALALEDARPGLAASFSLPLA